MCVICGKQTDEYLCNECLTLPNLEKICQTFICCKSKKLRESGYMDSSATRREALLKVVELSEKYTEFDLSYYRIKAFANLNTSYNSCIVEEGLLYEATHDDKARIVSVLREVVKVYLHEYEFYAAIDLCDRLLNEYGDVFAPYYKAECLMKIWLIDDAITELKELLKSLYTLKRKSTCESNAYFDRYISLAYSRLIDYKYKKKINYYFFPGKEEGMKKLLSILEAEGRNNDHKMFTYDSGLTIDTFVAFDFETTGTRSIDNITEIGAVKVRNGIITDRYSQLVNPGCSIPSRITELTGITNQMVANKPQIGEVFMNFIKFWGGLPLLAHDASFDMRLFLREAQKFNIKVDVPVIDTLSLARRIWPELERYKLSYLTDYFGIPHSHAHRAWCDAEATAKLYLRMLRENLADS